MKTISINSQPAEKQRSTPLLEVHSIFYTIQGEGPFAGQPAVFVRLAGCNLQCPGCDTDYTSKREIMSASDVHVQVRAAHVATGAFTKPLVVITGGEPFRQDIPKLVSLLLYKGYRVQIETNGTLFRPSSVWNQPGITIVCSPKAGKLSKDLVPHIDAFKYVMRAGSVSPVDGLPLLALDHSAAPQVVRPPAGSTVPVYLQPMDMSGVMDMKFDAMVANEQNLRACIESCMQFGYTLQVQIHKIINME